MKRIKLIIAYEGTHYCGWQIQSNGLTIEEVLNRTLTELLREPILVIGASRTDSGVHALGNVAVFDTNTRILPTKIAHAMNQRLPQDIVVQNSCEVALNFHPRHCDCIKTYEYRILNRKFQIPTMRRDTYFYYRDLDMEHMKEAAGYFIGTHDFKSFCSIHSPVKNTVRTILSCEVRKAQDLITICIKGDGFLYNMVRIIVGTLLKIGVGALKPTDVECILQAKKRSSAGPTAPAHGLTMIGIEYKL
ncbi:tRNA pseudouridine(38-40) synthase TruA [Lachnospiraceae bacterium ZAX-1]